MSEIHPGTVLEGYEFIEPIGKGGFSSVYTVRSLKYGQIFVAKITHVENENVDRAWQAFDCEFQALCRLNHPNIIKLYNSFRHGDRFILILEHLRGGSVSDYLQANGSMRKSLLVKTIREICSALNYAWARGVSHRDIKPANIMWDDNGRAKLVDFGISATAETGPASLLTDFRCSVWCAAPEVLQMLPHDPVKSDMWAVGITILWMAGGEKPMKSKDKAELLRLIQYQQYTIPNQAGKEIVKVAKAMLKVSPEERQFPTDEQLMALEEETFSWSGVNYQKQADVSVGGGIGGGDSVRKFMSLTRPRLSGPIRPVTAVGGGRAAVGAGGSQTVPVIAAMPTSPVGVGRFGGGVSGRKTMLGSSSSMRRIGLMTQGGRMRSGAVKGSRQGMAKAPSPVETLNGWTDGPGDVSDYIK